jgi:hypothetical protein
VVVAFANVSTVGDEILNTSCFDSQLLLSSPNPHDVTFPKIESAGEVENSNLGVLESFLIALEPFPKE